MSKKLKFLNFILAVTGIFLIIFNPHWDALKQFPIIYENVFLIIGGVLLFIGEFNISYFNEDPLLNKYKGNPNVVYKAKAKAYNLAIALHTSLICIFVNINIPSGWILFVLAFTLFIPDMFSRYLAKKYYKEIKGLKNSNINY